MVFALYDINISISSIPSQGNIQKISNHDTYTNTKAKEFQAVYVLWWHNKYFCKSVALR